MNYRRVHLDFHTSEKIGGIGKKFSKEQFQSMLKKGHVSSITLFAKCHHGWSYHPTRANEMHPGLEFDLLKAQIDAAHEIGVKTPVYISAGLDEKFCKQHHDWLMRTKDGKFTRTEDFERPGYHRPCFNSPYLEYLLEQIKEVCENYDADGIFLDIVGEVPCYCQTCRALLEAEGKNIEDEAAVTELAKRTYAMYTKAVREVVDSVKPGLPVFHNSGHITIGRRDLAAMNTHLELESLPTGGWGYDHFPTSVGYARTLGMDYLGMTGKFHTSWGEFGGYKHPNALKYEVALSAINGAACCIGDQLSPTGEMDHATYGLVGKAYEFLEEREEYLQNAKNVIDIGVIANEAYMNYLPNDDIRVEDGVRLSDTGCVRILLEKHFLFNMIDMEEDFSKYKLLILPDNIKLDDNLTRRIKQYLSEGGKILLSYKSGMNVDETEFAIDIGCKSIGMGEYQPSYIRPSYDIDALENAAYVVYSECMKVKCETGNSLGVIEKPYFNRSAEAFCSHLHTPSSGEIYGDAIVETDHVIYIAHKLFEEYGRVGSIAIKEIVAKLIENLLGKERSVKANLPSQGILTLMEDNIQDRQLVHLLYANTIKRGSGKCVEVIEDLIPLYNLRVSLKTNRTPAKVLLVPEQKELLWSYHDGSISFEVPKVDCWQIVEVWYK